MQIIIRPRQGGKTTEIIEWLNKCQRRVMLTHDRQTARALQYQYPELKERIVDWHTYIERHHGGPIQQEVAIDNADLILSSMLGRQLLGLVSLTQDDSESSQTHG